MPSRPVRDFLYVCVLGLVSACAATPKHESLSCDLLIVVEEDGELGTEFCKHLSHYVVPHLWRLQRCSGSVRIFLQTNDGTVMQAQDLAGIGDGAPEVRVKPDFEYVLKLNFITRTMQTATQGGNLLHSFSTDVCCSLTDIRTGEALFGCIFNGKAINRQTVMGLRGRVGGFDPADQRSVDAAARESAIPALEGAMVEVASLLSTQL